MDHQFVARLEILIAELAGGAYTRFAAMVGVSVSTMQRYLEGSTQPGYDVMRRLCLASGVTPNWLVFGWEPKYGTANKRTAESVRIVNVAQAGELRDGDFVTVPIFKPSAWADVARGVMLAGPDTTEGFTVVRTAEGGRLVAVRMADDSMLPDIRRGDLLVVDLARRDLESFESTMLVLTEFDDTVAPRWLVGDLLLSAVPHIHPPCRAAKRRVLGVVTEIRREDLVNSAPLPKVK